ncbi:hypothetical protein WICPIJ_004375 [Wickerhamomyces pijperi]|uniref:Uncharacterized protein n=1 Tax=Wickerhamomyces pijperi TaxID=599730 RepID=A0A9P8Q883_WICPI|nr:hypothetical protein WICPIJ_004375 [Wickerhamomyces pijperi]
MDGGHVCLENGEWVETSGETETTTFENVLVLVLSWVSLQDDEILFDQSGHVLDQVLPWRDVCWVQLDVLVSDQVVNVLNPVLFLHNLEVLWVSLEHEVGGGLVEFDG